MSGRVTFAALFLALLAGPVLAAPAQEKGEAGAGRRGANDEKKHPASRFMYLPPDIEKRVVFYHSFEKGLARPEIDLVGGKLSCGSKETAPGLTGRGLKVRDPKAARNPLRLKSPALSPHRGITVSMWWRPDEPMKDDTCYHLASLRGKGYISSFVRGKGQWCALKRPTFVFQLYNFPGIANRNDIWTGGARVDTGTWHHIAMTVAVGSEVRVYWDGKLRVRYSVKGRSLRPEDGVSLAEFGPTWLFHPMTLDEIVVLDRALTGEEIADYVTAVRRLAEVEFAFDVPDDGEGRKR